MKWVLLVRKNEWVFSVLTWPAMYETEHLLSQTSHSHFLVWKADREQQKSVKLLSWIPDAFQPNSLANYFAKAKKRFTSVHTVPEMTAKWILRVLTMKKHLLKKKVMWSHETRTILAITGYSMRSSRSGPWPVFHV